MKRGAEREPHGSLPDDNLDRSVDEFLERFASDPAFREDAKKEARKSLRERELEDKPGEDLPPGVDPLHMREMARILSEQIVDGSLTPQGMKELSQNPKSLSTLAEEAEKRMKEREID